jgi:hypothetical protein
MPNNRRSVILDKSFLQAESKDCRRLHFLKDAGCIFVLTDTLIYELCTNVDKKTQRNDQWPATQRKLFPFADCIEIWQHTAELLQTEIKTQKPINSPINQTVTDRFRAWFQSGQSYVQSDLKALAASAKKQWEGNSVDALIKECRDLCQSCPSYAATIQQDKAQAKTILADLMGHKAFINWRIKRVHGDQSVTDLYIKGAERGLGPEWFAYHETRSTLALCCVFMMKYGLKIEPGMDFGHTKLDADYASLLHYADGLATNETSGNLADMCEWLYGGSKRIFSTKNLDAAIPKEDKLREVAYQKWEQDGRTHGHDQSDWFWSKKKLAACWWERIGKTQTQEVLNS